MLINLATDLCEAYSGGTGVAYRGSYFSAAEVKALMERLNIIIFPCVNPVAEIFLRVRLLRLRNRNPADSGGVASKIGVDINRNQDFLWDLYTVFAPEEG